MFIYFEDWTVWKKMVEKKRIPRRFLSDKFIKALPSEADPRVLGFAGVVVEYSSEPFTEKDFFTVSGETLTITYAGRELEERVRGLGLSEQETAGFRALLRLGLDESFQYVERSVTTEFRGRRLKDHPVDTVELYDSKPLHDRFPHLDLFTIGTIDRLDGMIGFRENEGVLLTTREGISFRKGIPRSSLEGNRRARR